MAVPPKQTKEIHGVAVTQIQLQGKWYTGVDGRVKIAEHADPSLIRREGAGYNVLSVEFVQIGDKWAYHCMVEYPAGSGVVKPGTDFIDTKDVSGVAKAETSAIGRALGLHGIAIEESIASAEEMSRVEPNETSSHQHAPHSTPAANPAAQTEHAPSTSQDTPVPSSEHGTQADPMDTTTASAEEQQRLAEKLRTAGYDTLATAQRFMNGLFAKRAKPVNCAQLAQGTSDLSLRELATVTQRLTAQANGKAGAAR